MTRGSGARFHIGLTIRNSQNNISVDVIRSL